MKRLALLLGSLLVVSAAASAKEVVPAPVVVEEAPVQIVEKEVIVYRDKEEGFRPNGYVDLQYKYMGNTEGKGYTGEWNKNNNYSRTQLEGKIQMTEKQALDFRVRDYNSLDEHLYASANKGNKTETRLRYYYDHGLLGDSKADMTSMVRYEKSDANSQLLEYRLSFELADYMFDNDFVKTTTFVVGPRYIYNWDSSNGDNYSHTLGLYFDWINQLPWGFSTEVEIDGLDYNMYGDGARPTDGWDTTNNRPNLKDNDFGVFGVAAKIMHNVDLYSTDKYTVSWAFEGGYDTYNWSSIDKYGYGLDRVFEGKDYKQYYGDSTYELYAQPSLVFNYQATEFVNLYAQVGAEYRNWTVTAESEASHWRWQPFAIVGFRTTF